jgi:hypothetical protein
MFQQEQVTINWNYHSIERTLMFFTSSSRVKAHVKERVALKNTRTPLVFAPNAVLSG